MDPALRQQYMMTHMMVFEQLMRQMPPEQHGQLMERMGARVMSDREGNVFFIERHIER